MAKPFTPEQREELKVRIVGLVRKNERMTMSQLEKATGAGWHSIRRCLVDVLVCGDLYMSGKYGIFASEQAYHAWRKMPQKSDSALVRKLPDGEIRRYDRNQNMICRECRNSEVMQRVLAFYQGSFQEVVL
ncbi:DUF977 family protein [Escherichia coli]|uniref:DUF977 family protein n=1 Tax=Escherichia coli TaxID=562 RepID=UPI001992F34D|nr:DUF977 family protein [Escherichia coli]EGI3994556.1 DUF977 family protein [Escherichia coli]EGI4004348.1 DUF977 family protein [Escherichia coli]EGI4009500.1 DUF977 family protein [Escherichia coli]EGI4024047.1 DUF977 family protein [Escherichia coli]EGI4029055.1 DUF977 family protein [Escherichia coli]